MKRAVLEAEPGGRWYSECEDGSECDVGKVLVWDPPKRLEHRDLERFGERASELRKAIDAPSGWGKIIENFGCNADAT